MGLEAQATWCISTVISLGYPELLSMTEPILHQGLLARANVKALPGVWSHSCTEGCLDSHSMYNSKPAFLCNHYIVHVHIVSVLTDSTVSILKSIKHEWGERKQIWWLPLQKYEDRQWGTLSFSSPFTVWKLLLEDCWSSCKTSSVPSASLGPLELNF